MMNILENNKVYPFPGNLGALLDECREQYPERRGMGTPNRMLTFYEYYDRVCRLVHGFKETGVGPMDRVILSSLAPEGYAALSLALFRMGAVVVPVNPRMGPYELAHIVSETAPRLVICDKETLSTAQKGCETVPGTSRPGFMTLDQKAPSVLFRKEMDLSRADPTVEKMAPEDTAMIIYTAAMEGRPLGAQLTHGSLFADTAAFARQSFTPEGTEGEVLFSLLPLFHSYGFTNGFLVPLMGGVTCFLLGTSVRSKTVVGLMEQYRPTQIISVPAIFHSFLKSLSDHPQLCAGLRNLTSGGIGISRDLLDQYRDKLGLTISEGYGLTEASPVVTWNGLDRPPKFGSVGPPLSCCKIQIVDEKGMELPSGEEGEVLVRGSNLFSGYLNKPDETRKAFAEGWFKTGDVGWVDEENYLTLTGLKKDMINVFGLKAYPREIERLVMNHPDVVGARIQGEWHPRFGDMVAGDIRLRPGSTVTEKAFLQWCRHHISPYKVPRKVRLR